METLNWNPFFHVSEECQICLYPDAEFSVASLYYQEEKESEIDRN